MNAAELQDAGADPRAAIRARVAAAGTSFYWAMRLLPEERREAMFAVYAFCREVDDIADSDEAPAAKREGLAEWRVEIDAIYAGRPRHPLARVLGEVAEHYRLRREDFLAIIDGMEMDAAADIRAPGLAELDLYCDRVASAVGRLSVRIFGTDAPAADRVAGSLGRALQLTNILRDLVEDAERGRLYLPRELLERAGIAETEPRRVLQHAHLSEVCEPLANLAEQHFRDAARAMRECPRRPMRPAAVMGAVYHAILVRLRRRGWREPGRAVKLLAPLKLWLALRHGLL
ncbi:MAG TPA: presqualene diphosphate synthase HpnD [Stellaceae bacterium]|nr:presqualene diphosphate synthase HpnD [Stellaceae bacterium]